jgi:hypothetical protein
MQINARIVMQLTGGGKWLSTTKSTEELNVTCVLYVERNSLQKLISNFT